MRHQQFLSIVFIAWLSDYSNASELKSSKEPNYINDSFENTTINKSPADERSYATMRLNNNLHVLLISDPTSATSAASLSVGVGYTQDPDSQLGLAHYLEHVILLNSKSYPEINGLHNFLATKGYGLNGATGAQQTNFSFMCPTNNFSEALDRFADLFSAPQFDPELADKERNAVHNEWSLKSQNDFFTIEAIDYLTINPSHPLTRMSVGNLETLVNKKDSNLLDETKTFYRHYYSANNMRLTLIGKQSIELLKTYAELYFSTIPNRDILPPTITEVGLTKNELGKEIHYRPRGSQRSIYIDLPVKIANDQWSLKAKEYLIAVIGSESKGALSDWLRTQGLAEAVEVFLQPKRYGPDGRLRLSISLTANGFKQSDRVIAATFSYLDLIKEHGIKKQLFDELKNVAEKDFKNFKRDPSYNALVKLSVDQFIYPIEHIIDSAYIYDNFDENAIREFFEQWQPQNARIWYIDSAEKTGTHIPHYTGQYRIKDIPSEKISLWKDEARKIAMAVPELNELFTSATAPLAASVYQKPTLLISEPGIEAFLVNPFPNLDDQGKIIVELNSDINYKSEKNYLMSAILNEIIKQKNIPLISKAKKASIDVETTSENKASLTFTLSGYTAKQQLVLIQLLKGVKDLAISKQEFENAKKIVKRNQHMENYSVIQQLEDILEHTEFSPPLGRQETTKYIGNINFYNFEMYYKRLTENVLPRVFISGNFSEENARLIALQVKTIFPTQKKPQNRAIENYFLPRKNNLIKINSKTALNDSGVLDAYISTSQSIKERATIAILDRLISKEFFTQLRSIKQLGYVVAATPITFGPYNGYKFGIQSSDKDPDTLIKSIENFKLEYLKTLEATDLLTINNIKSTLKLEKKSTAYKSYSSDFLNAIYTFDTTDQYLLAIDEITIHDIIELYKNLIVEKTEQHIQLQMTGSHLTAK